MSSGDRYRSLFEASKDAIILHGLDGAILDANQSASRMFGYSVGEFRKLNVRDLHPEQVLTKSAELFDRIQIEGQITADLLFRRKDGDVFTAEVSSSLFDVDGTPHVQGILRDTTERRRMESGLRESEERFLELAGNIREVFWIYDVKRRKMVYASPAYEVVWGRKLNALYSEPLEWDRSLHPDDAEYARRTFYAVVETGMGGEHREYRIIRPNGEIRWVNDRAFAVRAADGSVARVVGIAEDITERKTAEEERQRLELRLRHAQKMEAIGELAGGIAHDFNNILAAIHGNAELLLMTVEEGGEEAELASDIVKSSRRAADLTGQLLAFAQKGRVRNEPIDLHDIVNSIVRLLRRSVDRRIDISVHLDAANPVVLGDRSQVEAAVLNLGINARDAMPEGGELTFTTSNVSLTGKEAAEHGSGLEGGAFVRLTVEDSGIGIPEDIRHRIFEPFFSTKTQGRGTGLGLASTYGCVTSHSGAIEVDGRAEGGTIFTVLLPTTEVEPVSETPAARNVHRGSGHILVVDDEAEVRAFASRALTRLGYRVSACRDGVEALEVFSEEHAGIDLVLLDMIMPRLSGTEVFPRLKKISPDVKVLLCSGFSRNESVEELISGGADGFLAKPFRLEDLSESVSDMLGERA